MAKPSRAFSLIQLTSTPTKPTLPSVPSQPSLVPIHDNRALASLLLVGAVITAISAPLHLLEPEISPGSHTVRLILHIFNCLTMLTGYLLTRRGYGRFGLPLVLASWLVTVYIETLILQGSDHFQLLFAMILPVFVATIFRGTRYALVVAAFGLSAMLSLPFVMNSVSLQDILGPTLLLSIATVMAVATARAGRDYEASRRLSLAESEERYRALFHSVSDILFTVSPTGELMQANPAIERELGWQIGELIGQNIGSYMQPEDMERARVLFKSAIAQGSAVPVFEARMRTRGGEYAWFEFTCTLHMHQGELATVSGSGRNVSERRQSEAKRLQEAIAREQALLMQRLVPSITHDFRTSLSNIETNRYLIERALTDEQREKLKPRMDVVRAQVTRLNDQIQNMNIMASLSRPNRAPVDLSRLVQQAAADQAATAAARHITFTVEIGAETTTIMGDSNHLYHAVRHLLVNAITHSPEHEQVTLILIEGEDRIWLSVADTGTGIAPEHHQHIFEPFYRVDNARSISMGGVGIGLTIVKLVAEEHGGHVQVDSAPGLGSVFTLELPRG